MKSLGTTVPPRTPTERLSSISRTSRRPELDGPQPALERPGEHALHQALQPAFEPPDSHRRRGYRPPAGTGWGAPRLGATRLPAPLGRVAELADALASGASVRKDVGVQVPPRPRSARRTAAPRASLCEPPAVPRVWPAPTTGLRLLPATPRSSLLAPRHFRYSPDHNVCDRHRHAECLRQSRASAATSASMTPSCAPPSSCWSGSATSSSRSGPSPSGPGRASRRLPAVADQGAPRSRRRVPRPDRRRSRGADLRNDILALVRQGLELLGRPATRAALPGLLAETAADRVRAEVLDRAAGGTWGWLQRRIDAAVTAGEVAPMSGVDGVRTDRGIHVHRDWFVRAAPRSAPGSRGSSI